ncbi:MAG: glycosyltransferase, partial [Candidatus Aureabacteria bacterium]|nr:glycosyltransferase [Candidatus Auribacterota bacterium]
MKEIHQLIAGATVGDAITNYALEIRDILRSSGLRSEIFAPLQHTAPELKAAVLPVSEHVATLYKKDITLFYHFSIGSEMTEYFIQAQGWKVLCYHNITPEKYFRYISDQRANLLKQGREELKALCHVPDITLADSGFNARELEEFGFSNPLIVNLTLNENFLKKAPSKKIIRTYKDSFTNFLFVGRVAPNKKLEDALKVFYYYNKTINPSSRLILAGSYSGMEKYYNYLRSLACEMGLHDVVFTGHVSLEELLGYYAASSLFLCMSEHEGLCIPLIESMYFRKPVFALARTAMPETMGDAGVLIYRKNHRAIAELINIVLNDKNILQNIIEKQNERIKDFHKDILKKKLKTILGF